MFVSVCDLSVNFRTHMHSNTHEYTEWMHTLQAFTQVHQNTRSFSLSLSLFLSFGLCFFLYLVLSPERTYYYTHVQPICLSVCRGVFVCLIVCVCVCSVLVCVRASVERESKN